MTKKHFRALAQALHSCRPPKVFNSIGRLEEDPVWWSCCTEVASACSQPNPNFDHERFLNWCKTGSDAAPLD